MLLLCLCKAETTPEVTLHGPSILDLGLDPLFKFDEDGNLIGEYDGTWIAIDRQPVAFYHLTTIDKGDRYRILGYVPAFLNDQHVNLILVFDNLSKILSKIPDFL